MTREEKAIYLLSIAAKELFKHMGAPYSQRANLGLGGIRDYVMLSADLLDPTTEDAYIEEMEATYGISYAKAEGK